MQNKPSRIRIAIYLFLIICCIAIYIYGSVIGNRYISIFSAIGGAVSLIATLTQAFSPFQATGNYFFESLEKMLQSTLHKMQKSLYKFLSMKKVLYPVIVLFLIISTNLAQWLFFHPGPPPTCNTPICILPKTVDDSVIRLGINDGSIKHVYFNQFDQEPDSRCTNYIAAQTTAAQLECDIYQENSRILKPYISFLIVTTLSRTVTDPNASLAGGINDLRGAYLAQHNYNMGHTMKLRLLIANMGTKKTSAQTAPDLVRQIELLPRQDKTFVGIVGFPFSVSALAALSSFKNHNIPIVSPSATSSDLSNEPNFYRIVSPDTRQSAVLQTFITTRLPANLQTKCIAVFYDLNEPSSKTLGVNMLNSGIPHPIPEIYVGGKPDSLYPRIDEVISSGCGTIFFSGFPADLSSLKDILHTKAPRQDILIIGGGALYNLGGYTSNDQYKNLFFIANATGDALNPNADDPHFLNEYAKTFDPQNKYQGRYGPGKPEVQAILSFDAVSTFLHALMVDNSTEPTTSSPSLESMSRALPRVVFNGESGLISFQSSSSTPSDPINKPVYIACVDSDSYTHTISTYQLMNDKPTEVGNFDSGVLEKCLKSLSKNM